MKAWLKYGLIFGGIHLIIGLFILIIPFILYGSGDLSILLSFIDFPIIFIIKSLPSTIGIWWREINLLIFGTIQWFAIGSVIGWIIGKFKK
jgi:hypothetical protein